MSLWLDITYCKQILPRFDRYKIKQDGMNFLVEVRCSICGDSQTRKNKMRGYFYVKKGSLNYKCFNCNASMSFNKFLKDFDMNLYNRLCIDKFKDNNNQTRISDDLFLKKTPPETQKYIPNILSSLTPISKLQNTHFAKKEILRRRIPTKFFSGLFYAEKFIQWTRGHTDKFAEFKSEQSRLIIPWYSDDGVLFAYSARALKGEEPKYFNIVLDDTKPKFFGLDRVDNSKPIYVLEGQFDSMFVPNAVAVANSAIGQFSRSDMDDIYIPDADVRNRDIMRITKDLIDRNKKVCMFPREFGGKDINEMVINKNLTTEQLIDIIDKNVYKGLSAQLKFLEWSKV